MIIKGNLEQRFEVVRDYPEPKNHPKYDVGDIVGTNTNEDVQYFSNYPSLFRLMDWWEKRKECEMPMYLKHTIDKEIWTYHKIEKWNMDSLDGFISVEKREVCSLLSWSKEYTYQPITEQEYLDSLSCS